MTTIPSNLYIKYINGILSVMNGDYSKMNGAFLMINLSKELN